MIRLPALLQSGADKGQRKEIYFFEGELPNLSRENSCSHTFAL